MMRTQQDSMVFLSPGLTDSTEKPDQSCWPFSVPPNHLLKNTATQYS